MKTKLISVILVLTMLLLSAAVLANAESTVKLGDINGDGKITSTDARLALRAAAQIDVLTADQFKAADTDFNGRITATDARAILRAAAQIDTLPEIPTEATSEATTEATTEAPTTEATTEAPTTEATTTEEPTTEEPTTEAPTTEEPTTEAPTTEEPTTEEPTTEEPTTEEPTTEEPDTGVVVSEYPDVIDTFFSGKFYLKCDLGSEDDEAKVEIAANGKNYELASKFGDFSFNIYYYRYTTYLKNPAKKTYVIYDKKAKEELSALMGGQDFDFDFDQLLAGFEFGKIEVTEDPVLTQDVFQEEPCDVYTFNTPNGKTAFYFVEEDLKAIVQLDEAGKETSAILVDTLSSKIPSGMLTISGYKKQDILSFLFSLIPDDLLNQ